MLCLSLLYVYDSFFSKGSDFLEDVRFLTQALRLNTQQPEVRNLIQLRQQPGLNVALSDAVSLSSEFAHRYHDALRIATSGIYQSDYYIILKFKVRPVLIEQSRQGDLVCNLSPRYEETLKIRVRRFRSDFQPSADKMEPDFAEEYYRTVSDLESRRANMSGKLSIMLCEHARPGDYLLHFESRGWEEWGFCLCLIVRQCPATRLFQIIGQGFAPWHDTLAGAKPAGVGYPSDLKFYFDKEDLLAFALPDMFPRDGSDEDTLNLMDMRGRYGSREPRRLQRIFTAVTKSHSALSPSKRKCR